MLDFARSAPMASVVLEMPRLSSIIINCHVFGCHPFHATKGTLVDWGTLARTLLSEASSPRLKALIIKGRRVST